MDQWTNGPWTMDQWTNVVMDQWTNSQTRHTTKQAKSEKAIKKLIIIGSGKVNDWVGWWGELMRIRRCPHHPMVTATFTVYYTLYTTYSLQLHCVQCSVYWCNKVHFAVQHAVQQKLKHVLHFSVQYSPTHCTMKQNCGVHYKFSLQYLMQFSVQLADANWR